MHPLFTILLAKRGCIISSFYFHHIIVAYMILIFQYLFHR